MAPHAHSHARVGCFAALVLSICIGDEQDKKDALSSVSAEENSTLSDKMRFFLLMFLLEGDQKKKKVPSPYGCSNMFRVVRKVSESSPFPRLLCLCHEQELFQSMESMLQEQGADFAEYSFVKQFRILIFRLVSCTCQCAWCACVYGVMCIDRQAGKHSSWHLSHAGVCPSLLMWVGTRRRRRRFQAQVAGQLHPGVQWKWLVWRWWYASNVRRTCEKALGATIGESCSSVDKACVSCGGGCFLVPISPLLGVCMNHCAFQRGFPH